MITAQDVPRSLEKKLVAVVSEKLEVGTAMNAVAHMSLGLGAILGQEATLLCDYRDANGMSHPAISAYPFIILKGRPSKIREAIDLAKERGVQVVNFVNTMTVGSYVDQLKQTLATANQDLEFYGAAFFGETSAVSEITKKFSLFR